MNAFHSILIIIVLVIAVLVVVKSMISLFAGLHYSSFDRILAMIFVILVIVQSLAEIILFVNSGFGYRDEGFSAVERVLLTIVAAGAVILGRAISKKSGDNVVKFRFRTIFYGIASLLLFINFLLS